MSKIINLRTAKKQKVRTDKQQKAAQNRRKFGRTKTEITQAKQAKTRADQLLDGHQLSKD